MHKTTMLMLTTFVLLACDEHDYSDFRSGRYGNDEIGDDTNGTTDTGDIPVGGEPLCCIYSGNDGWMACSIDDWNGTCDMIVSCPVGTQPIDAPSCGVNVFTGEDRCCDIVH